MSGTKFGQYLELTAKEKAALPGTLKAWNAKGIEALRRLAEQNGLVLDPRTVKYEGVKRSQFNDGFALLYTATGVPRGTIADDGRTDHCGCCGHRRRPGGCGGPGCGCLKSGAR